MRIFPFEPPFKRTSPPGIGIFCPHNAHTADRFVIQGNILRAAAFAKRLCNGERHQSIVRKIAMRAEQGKIFLPIIPVLEPAAHNISYNRSPHLCSLLEFVCSRAGDSQ